MRLQSSMKRAFLLGLCFVSAVLSAQEPGENLAASAEENFRNGNYKHSAEVCRQFIDQFPTSPLINNVRYQYGLSLLLDGQYETSIKLFQELSKPGQQGSELRQQAKLLLGNAYRGMALTRNKQERVTLLKNALDAFNDYLKEYGPKGLSGADAVYGRASVYSELEQYDEAIKDLESFSTQFAGSPLLFESEQLLGKVYAAKASLLFKQGRTSDAEACLRVTEEKFEKVGAQEKNPLLVNEAFFSAGKVFLDFGQYEKSLMYFRRVRPKNELLEYQRAKIQKLREERIALFKEGGKINDSIKNEIERETGKLNRLLNQYDLYLASQQYIAQVFLNQRKYDESIIVNQRFIPFFDEELRKFAEYQIAIANLEKGELKVVEELAVSFADKYKGDTTGDDLFYRLGEKVLALGDVNRALRLFQLSVEKYPAGSCAELSLLTRASLLSEVGQANKVTEVYTDFFKTFPKSALLDRALYLRGLHYQKQGKVDLSTKDFSEIQQSYPASKYKEDAFFRIGLNLNNSGKPLEAIEHFIRFEKLFPKSELASAVLYQLGYSYEMAKKYDLAIETHRRNVKEHPTGEMAPYSFFAMGVIYFNQKKYDEMEKVLQEYIAQYPQHKNVGDAQNLMAYAFQLKKDYDKAIQLYKEVVKKNPANPAGARAQLSLGLCYLAASTDVALHPNALPKPEKEKWADNNKKAIDAFSKVLSEFPSSRHVDEALSNLMMAWKSRMDASLATYEEGQMVFGQLAMSARGDKALAAKVRFTYGAFLAEIGKTSDALPVFEEAYAASKGVLLPVESYKKYLNVLVTHDPPLADQAIVVAQRLMTENKDNPSGLAEGYYWTGRAFFEKGNLNEADSYFEKARGIHEIAGTDLENEIKLFQGRLLESRKQYNEAIRVYQELQRAVPVKMKVEPIMRMGYAFEARGDNAGLENAYKKFQEVIINFPGSAREAEALLKAAEIASKLKRNDEAKKLLGRLQKEFPNSKWTQEALKEK